MKSTLTTGVERTRALTVDADRTIGFMGEEGRVYSTPDLLRDIEQTCRDLLLEHCDAGEDSVGTQVKLAHLAATPPGLRVEITARVTEVDGQRVRFAVSARDSLEPICEAEHERFVVDVARTIQRLARKAAKAAGN